MKGPTARELLDGMFGMTPNYGLLAARVEKVLALHRRVDAPSPWCGHCIGDDPDDRFVDWPCPTVRLLNREEA